MSLVVDELIQLSEAKELIKLRLLDREEILGVVLNVNEEQMIIEEYSTRGIFEGHFIIFLDFLDELLYGNRYLNSIKKLLKPHAFKDSLIVRPDIQHFLAYFKEHEIFIELYIRGDEGNFNVGKVIDFDEDSVKLNAVGNLSQLDSYTIVLPLDEVLKIGFNTSYIGELLGLYTS